MNILLLGGLGFIGANLANYLNTSLNKIIIVDKGTYAADHSRLNFQPEAIIIRDLCNGIEDILSSYKPEIIINLAAESHVDNSLNSSLVFWQSNVIGTAIAMEQIAKICPKSKIILFSTDECIGPHINRMWDQGDEEPHLDGPFYYNPMSPYSASKAAQELAAISVSRRYGLQDNLIIVRPNNVIGPTQNAEKLVPKTIQSILNNQPITVYGEGKQRRHWLFIDDLCEAITLLAFGKSEYELDQTEVRFYNISADHSTEITNLELVNKIKMLMEKPDHPIKFVPDRHLHDDRYYTSSFSLQCDFGWEPKIMLDEALKRTIEYYVQRQ